MRQTQINGETYVNCNDVVDWLKELAKVADDQDVSMKPGSVIAVIYDGLDSWSKHKSRKIGIPDIKMPTIKS